MNECGFWFWFIKPFAEFASGIVMFAIFVFVFFIIQLIMRKKSQNNVRKTG